MATKGRKGTVDVHVWLPPALLVEVMEIAKAERRSRQFQLQVLIEEAIIQRRKQNAQANT